MSGRLRPLLSCELERAQVGQDQSATALLPNPTSRCGILSAWRGLMPGQKAVTVGVLLDQKEHPLVRLRHKPEEAKKRSPTSANHGGPHQPLKKCILVAEDQTRGIVSRMSTMANSAAGRTAATVQRQRVPHRPFRATLSSPWVTRRLRCHLELAACGPVRRQPSAEVQRGHLSATARGRLAQTTSGQRV